MTADPRAALNTLVGAFERHLEAAASRRGENDPTVVASYRDLADAFETYDDALMDTYGEVTPLEIYSGDDDDPEDEDDLEPDLLDGDDDRDDSDDDGDDGDDDGDLEDDLDDEQEQDGRYVGLSGDDIDDLEYEDTRK